MTTAAPGGEPRDVIIRIDGTEVSAGELPYWRRPRKLRRQLVGTLIIVAFVSVALIGGLNFVAARRLLDDGTQEQLASIAQARARSIEAGIDRIASQASAAAADLAVVDALEELSASFDPSGTGRLDETQVGELDDFYQTSVVEPVAEAGLGPVTVDELRPSSETGRYLQYHYTLPSDDVETRRDVADAGDGSVYSEAHARHHEALTSLADSLGVGDLMLVADGEVVYSADKRIDFATDLVTGPYDDTALARTLRRQLPQVRVGEGVIADLELYLPAGGHPVFFVTASVRRGTEVIGALVLEVPVEALNEITTAGQNWEEVGLRDGESYVVGSDLLLRSESRPWIEDPEGYLDRVDDQELASLIRTFDSPVGLQPVDTEPVNEALSGGVFEGTAGNYLGQGTYSYATLIDAPGVDLVVVADVPLTDARQPLYDYAKRLALVLLIFLPVGGLVGFFMADRLTRPIGPVVQAARAVAAGERDPDLPDLGRDEFGDLARRLGNLAGELKEQEVALADEYEERRQLLLSILPPHIVEEDGQLVGSEDVADTATVLAVRVDVLGDLAEADDEVGELLHRALEQAESLAAEHGLERIRAGADSYLFLAGVGNGDGADEGLDFAVGLTRAVASLGDGDEFGLAVHMGLSTGPVATGVLERGSLTFAAWGEPVRRALAIGALALSDEILVDASTVAAATAGREDLHPADDVVDLDGQPMQLSSLRLG